jgi:DNA invertase Pin-like site-specific DNA recombinase
MPVYGYARVSTLDQDLSIQQITLQAAGCSVIRAESAVMTVSTLRITGPSG